MIGIIGAMTVEIEGLKNRMTDVTVTKSGALEYISGKLCGVDTVAAVSGEGKVNAAMCTQAMIMRFKPDFIINTGVGGGIASGLKIGDIVVGASVAEHDMDMTPLGYDHGYICGIDGIYMSCDENLSKDLCGCLDRLGYTYRRGTIVSGDQFVASSEKKKWLADTFNASVCEMEGAAIGHVCVRNNLPFAVIRAISDGGDDEASISFPEFAAAAAERSVKTLIEFAKSKAAGLTD